MKPSFEQRPIVHKALSDLVIHRSLKGMPHFAKDDPRYVAMKSAWLEANIIPPLYVTPAGEIADGRHRYWFAKDMRLETVPCIEITPEEVPLVIMSGLTGRANTTKGQRAYIAAPYFQAAFEAAKERRLKILASKGKAALPALSSMDDLADKIGVNPETLRQARKLHELFAKDPALKEEFEPQILAEDSTIGLGAILAGIASKTKTKGKTPKRNSRLKRFVDPWKAMSRQVAQWDKLGEDDRQHAETEVRKSFAAMPLALLELVVKEAAERVKAAKAASATAAPASPAAGTPVSLVENEPAQKPNGEPAPTTALFTFPTPGTTGTATELRACPKCGLPNKNSKLFTRHLLKCKAAGKPAPKSQDNDRCWECLDCGRGDLTKAEWLDHNCTGKAKPETGEAATPEAPAPESSATPDTK